MALRDWLNPDFDPLATENPAICAENKQKIATIAPEIASPAILQNVDSNDKLSRNSKNSKNSSSNAPELKNAGLKRLEAAAAGLPIPLDELAVIFADDLEDFGAGAVSMAGIRQACEFYAKNRHQPQREEVPAGMVRCTDCQQGQCPYPLTHGRHTSEQFRWCKNYTARVIDISIRR